MRDSWKVRITLDIDDDVLQAVNELAAVRGITEGRAISELARKGLTPARTSRARNGVPLLPLRAPGAPRPTMKRVNDLRDQA